SAKTLPGPRLSSTLRLPQKSWCSTVTRPARTKPIDRARSPAVRSVSPRWKLRSLAPTFWSRGPSSSFSTPANRAEPASEKSPMVFSFCWNNNILFPTILVYWGHKVKEDTGKEPKIMVRKIIHIDQEKCNGCGACASACHEGAIAMVNGKAQLLRDDYCD